jgi:hypothetical protein
MMDKVKMAIQYAKENIKPMAIGGAVLGLLVLIVWGVYKLVTPKK